jgi:hypothetical protein
VRRPKFDAFSLERSAFTCKRIDVRALETKARSWSNSSELRTKCLLHFSLYARRKLAFPSKCAASTLHAGSI